MLVTRQPVLRRFWYATVAVARLNEGPQAFTLLGEPLVLFRDAAGQPACLADRCCHRTAKLSKGWLRDGRIVCGYHGWEYDGAGRVVRIPQWAEDQAIPADFRTRSFRTAVRYGYVWVALEEPLAGIPDFPEEHLPGWRMIHQFDETWASSPLRFMENSFDNAHFAFVHRATFGDTRQPKPQKYELNETEWGFEAESIVGVANPPKAARITGTTEPFTTRHMRNKWFVPFSRRLDMEYPSGLRHIILNCTTPIDDGHMQVIQVLFRNDDEASCPAQVLIDWDAAITAEDREILEATDYDAVLDATLGAEMSMPSDRPGMIMRRRLLALLAAHGEIEQTRHMQYQATAAAAQ